MMPDHEFRVQAGKKRVHVRLIESWPASEDEGGHDPTEIRVQLTIVKAKHLAKVLEAAADQVTNGGDMVVEV
jgi:hypothetical protein